MRPIGPRTIDGPNITDVPIVLDWYNRGNSTALLIVKDPGPLSFAAEFIVTNPFTDPTPSWISLGTGTNIPSVGRYFSIPSAASAVRVRSTTGTGSISYAVLMPGGG
jgi:hypothetical protein